MITVICNPLGYISILVLNKWFYTISHVHLCLNGWNSLLSTLIFRCQIDQILYLHLCLSPITIQIPNIFMFTYVQI